MMHSHCSINMTVKLTDVRTPLTSVRLKCDQMNITTLTMTLLSGVAGQLLTRFVMRLTTLTMWSIMATATWLSVT